MDVNVKMPHGFNLCILLGLMVKSKKKVVKANGFEGYNSVWNFTVNPFNLGPALKNICTIYCNIST